MEPLLPPIPERLRELRDARGFSLEDLAKRSGVSRAMLSKIERGAASPTIGLLCKITGALGVPLTRLVAEPGDRRCRMVRKEEMLPLTDALSGVTRTSVSTELKEWGIELVRYDLPAGSSTGECGGCTTGQREILHIAEGEIEVRMREATERVRAGETLLLESGGSGSCGYEIRNPGKEPAVLYFVIDRRQG